MIFRVNKIAVLVCNWNVDIALFGCNMLDYKILRVYKIALRHCNY